MNDEKTVFWFVVFFSDSNMQTHQINPRLFFFCRLWHNIFPFNCDCVLFSRSEASMGHADSSVDSAERRCPAEEAKHFHREQQSI